MANHHKLQCAIELARTCVHQAQAPQALEHLRSVRWEIEDMVGSSLWAEYQWVYAGALAAMNQSSAETAFEDALKRIGNLSEPNPALAMTTHGDYAKYLVGRQAPKRARDHYQQAEKIAARLEREECAAHFQMCIIRLELEVASSPHLRTFQRLQEAAKDGYTEVQQRDAWIDYTDMLEAFEPQLVAARKGAEASVEFFRGMLSKIRKSQK